MLIWVQIYIKIIEEHIILLKNKENAEKRHGISKGFRLLVKKNKARKLRA